MDPVTGVVAGEVLKFFLNEYFRRAREAGMTQAEIDAQILTERDKFRDNDPAKLPQR